MKAAKEPKETQRSSHKGTKGQTMLRDSDWWNWYSKKHLTSKSSQGRVKSGKGNALLPRMQICLEVAPTPEGQRVMTG